MFAGRDASRGLAKQSFEEDMLTPLDQEIDSLSDLTKAEWDNLLGWESESTVSCIARRLRRKLTTTHDRRRPFRK